jgi:hypothetical protein
MLYAGLSMDLVLDGNTSVADAMFWMGAGVSGVFV